MYIFQKDLENKNVAKIQGEKNKAKVEQNCNNKEAWLLPISSKRIVPVPWPLAAPPSDSWYSTEQISEEKMVSLTVLEEVRGWGPPPGSPGPSPETQDRCKMCSNCCKFVCKVHYGQNMVTPHTPDANISQVDKTDKFSKQIKENLYSFDNKTGIKEA